MSIFELPDFDAHEQVVFVDDKQSGLKAIIALHNTRRGPALGGCRRWHYDNSVAAVTDVLRLSRGMTYKNAMADLPIGGGKAVILGGSRKSPELYRAFARAVDRLGGRYITAEDVGTTPEDIKTIREETKHVAGMPSEWGGHGSPAPMTALGVFVGIEAAIKHRLDRESVAGLSIAIQGLGSVGFDLARRLHEAGANLIVTDLDPSARERAVRELNVRAVAPEAIYDCEVDVFAPCALGAILNSTTLPRLRCKVVAGAANNQLASEEVGEQLRKTEILYAPDYVINAGGVIKACAEYFGEPAASVEGRVRRIADTLTQVFSLAQRESIATNRAADLMAEARFA